MTIDSNVFKEGCQIYGNLEVNRVGGSFHIAPGKSYSVNHVHGKRSIKVVSTGNLTFFFSLCVPQVHDVQPYSSEDFNMTHTINFLSFGRSIEWKANPLDGYKMTAEKGK